MNTPGDEDDTPPEQSVPERGEEHDQAKQQEMMMNSGNWLECSIYQNYTASEVLVQGLAGVVNQVMRCLMMMK